MDDLNLSPEEVLAQLEQTAKRDRKHAAPWTVIASLLHRVEIEGLYRQKIAWHGQPYETAEEYADIELEMPRSQFFATRRLGNLIERDRLQPWEKLTRSQAVQISRLAGLDDVGLWVQKALSMPYSRFRREVERALKPGEDLFIRYGFFGPESFALFWNEALVDGLRVVLDDPDPDPTLIDDPSLRFRCVEVFVMAARDANLAVSALARALGESVVALEAAGRSDLAEQITAQVVEIAGTITTRTAPPPRAGMDQSASHADGAAESRRDPSASPRRDGAAEDMRTAPLSSAE